MAAANPKPVSTLLAEVAKEAGAVGRDSQNRQQGYQFRSHEAVVNRIAPLLAEKKVVCIPTAHYEHAEATPVKSKGGAAGWRVVIPYSFTFYGPAGDSITATTIGEGVDYGDKATNKAATAAHKYALTMALTLPTGEPDADSESHDLHEARAASMDTTPAKRQQGAAPANPVNAAKAKVLAALTKQFPEADDKAKEEAKRLWPVLLENTGLAEDKLTMDDVPTILTELDVLTIPTEQDGQEALHV